MPQLICGFVLGLFFFLTPAAKAQDLCTKTCVIDAECGIGGQCAQGVCRYQDFYCGNERWSVNSRGETSNCDAYRCSPVVGTCLRSASSSLDCLTGYVFDGQHSCVPSIQCQVTDPACLDLYERWRTARLEYEDTTPEPQPAALSCVSCQTDLECSGSQMCWKGQCTDRKNYCEQDARGEHFQVDIQNGTKSSCGLYACEKVLSQCLTSCYKSSDCREGRNCRAGLCL